MKRNGMLGVTRVAARLPGVNRSSDDSDGLLAEYVELWTAESADDLQRVLALRQPFRASADWSEPLQLLAKHHENEPHTSTVTATLLLTDTRWRKGVGRLVGHIAGSGMIEAADLDILARTFVAAGDHVYWEVPESWFGNESAIIYIDAAADGPDDIDVVPDDKGLVVARRVHPPLRRWAAAHLVARDPSEWGLLFANARDRLGAHGAAILRGLLDGLDHVPDDARRTIIDAGIEWPQPGVRKHALERLADLGDRQLAHDRALRDAGARIREWAPALLETEPAAPGEPADPGDETITPPAQSPLF